MRTLLVIAVAAALLLPLASADAAKKLRKPRHGIQLRPSPYTVGPGEDREWCEYVRAPVKKPMYVSGFEVRMPPGAHHFVVWGYGGDVQDDSKFPSEPVESVGCTGLGPRDEIAPRVIIPLQSPNKRFDLPKGLALRIDPGQQLWLNPHLRNPSLTEAVVPEIRANFYAAKPASVKHLVEGLIAGNIPDINIPAHGEQRLTAEFTAPINLNIVFLATHQHRLGTYANIELVENGIPHQIYESYRWDHPPDLWPQAPIRLAKGDKMRITCEWKNTDPVAIHFGPNTTDEMCFILGFYYRDDGDTEEVPFGQCLPSASGLLCTFAPKVN